MEERENRGSISDIFSRVAETVPDSEWAKVPTDLSRNVDHYLYGNKTLTE